MSGISHAIVLLSNFVLLKRFRFKSGHTIGFHLGTQKLEAHYMFSSLTQAVKELRIQTKKVDERVFSSKLDQLHVILHNFFHLEHR